VEVEEDGDPKCFTITLLFFMKSVKGFSQNSFSKINNGREEA